jgi:hypothetical protein
MIHHVADDVATAAEIERLLGQLVPRLAERWGLVPPSSFEIYVVESWPQLLSAGSSWLERLMSLALLPHQWYWLSFQRGWDDVYCLAICKGPSRSIVRAKAPAG